MDKIYDFPNGLMVFWEMNLKDKLKNKKIYNTYRHQEPHSSHFVNEKS